MKKLLLAICLILLISIAALVPGCNGTTGTIEVDATLDGPPWTGAVDYTLTPGTGSPVSGTSVDDTFTVDAGNWTCAYVSGGPGVFVSYTPDPPTQELSAGGTIGFTLNFETSVTPTLVDASVEFVCWTVNGTPVPPGTPSVWVGPGAIIDAHFKKHVSGEEEGAKVTVDQTDWLDFHNDGYEGEQGGPTITLHCVNGWGAVTTEPDSTKLSQKCTVDGDPVSPCYRIEDIEYCEHVDLDVETSWEQKICTNYTKNINWIGLPGGGGGALILADPGNVLWEIESPLQTWQSFDLVASACVEVGEGFEDTDQGNDCDTSAPLLVIYNGPPIP
jgi:hypothetical protein